MPKPRRWTDLFIACAGVVMAAGVVFLTLSLGPERKPWYTLATAALGATALLLAAYLSWRAYRTGLPVSTNGRLWIALRGVLWVGVLVQLVPYVWKLLNY